MNNKDGENATRLYFTRIWRRGIKARYDKGLMRIEKRDWMI